MVYIMLGFLRVASPELSSLSSLDSTSVSLAPKVDSLHYLNPVYNNDWSDPTVWMGDDSCYYSFSTSGFKDLRPIQSNDLVHWAKCKKQIISNRIETYLLALGKTLSSPQMTTIKGEKRLYISCSYSVDDTSIAVLVEDPKNPEQFKFRNRLIIGKEIGIKDCIDPYVIEDPINNSIWLFFGGSYGIYRVELSSDGLNVKEGSFPSRVAGVDVTTDRQRDKVFRSGFIKFHQGYWYLFVSSGHYNTSSSTLKVGRSATLNGEFVDRNGRPMLSGNATPLFTEAGDGYFYGPGSVGEIITMKDGKSYVFYHCHNIETKSETTYNPCPLMLQELLWDKSGWPILKGTQLQRIGSRPAL